jgi:hypothetical protein
MRSHGEELALGNRVWFRELSGSPLPFSLFFSLCKFPNRTQKLVSEKVLVSIFLSSLKDMVAYTCNSSYMGGRDWKNFRLKPGQAKN